MDEVSDNCVTIRIKSASHRCEDLEFSCDLSSTIFNVKKIIQQKNPLHPGVSEQRLIYSGHLLDDDKLIRDVVAQNAGSDATQSAFTFHLACSSKSYVPYNTVEQRNPSMNSGIPQEPDQTRINPPTFTTSTPSGGIPPDVLALHQMYVEQMMSFMAQWSQGGVANYGMPNQYQFPEPPQANANYANVQEEIMRAARNEPRDNARVNEAGRVRVEDEENPRDMLDWMYTFSRLVLVFSVVYFYSNFTRFFLVVIFTALVMVMQRRHQGNNVEGEARVQDAAEAHPVPPQQAPATPDPQDQNIEDGTNGQEIGPDTSNAEAVKPDDIINGEAEGGSETEGSSSPQEIVQEPPVPARLNQLRDISWTFLTTFFTSLIPDTPQNN